MSNPLRTRTTDDADEFDETFWAWVQQPPPTTPATPACPLKFFKELREDEDSKLLQKMQQVYDSFFDEIDEMDRFEQDIANAVMQCNRPKEHILDAMRYLKCTPDYAVDMFNAIDDAYYQVEQEVAAAAVAEWESRRAHANAHAQRLAYAQLMRGGMTYNTSCYVYSNGRYVHSNY